MLYGGPIAASWFITMIKFPEWYCGVWSEIRLQRVETVI